MEVHVSSDDRNFVANICSDITDRLKDLRGIACISGYNLSNQYEYKIFEGKDDITNKFPKRITFGEMINLMRQFKSGKLYFQREDWRGTHNYISLDDSDGRNLYIEQYYEDDRYKDGQQYFDECGIPLRDCKPYIPTYDDMFIHSWIICDFNGDTSYEEEDFDGSTI